MEILASLVIVPVGTLFFLSGLIVNLIQSHCVRKKTFHGSRSPLGDMVVVYVLVRPFAKNVYRRINKVVAELLWLELIWLFDWWAGVKVELYADSETIEMIGKENALVICNHRSDIDWLVGWVLAQRSGCLGSSLAIMKKPAKFIPIIGWSMWLSDYIFMDGSWAKDETRLKSGFKGLADFPRPFWLALFVEGTRFTQANLLAAQEYAFSRELPVPRNVLIPRTKGFVTAVTHMRSYVPAIYDCTFDVSKDEPSASMLRICGGQSSVVKLQMRRHSTKDLPETEEGIAQWCRDIFVTKDDFLEKYKTKGIFGSVEPQDIGRPVKSLIVVISWSCLLSFGIVMFFMWSSLLSTWQGIVSVCVVFVIIGIIMQVLVHCSKVGGLTPETTRSMDPSQEKLLGR